MCPCCLFFLTWEPKCLHTLRSQILVFLMYLLGWHENKCLLFHQISFFPNSSFVGFFFVFKYITKVNSWDVSIEIFVSFSFSGWFKFSFSRDVKQHLKYREILLINNSQVCPKGKVLYSTLPGIKLIFVFTAYCDGFSLELLNLRRDPFKHLKSALRHEGLTLHHGDGDVSTA